MADRIHFWHNLLIAVVTVLQSVAGAVVTYITLRIGMQITGLPMTEAYQALLIIVALLALIFFRGLQTSELHSTPSWWSVGSTVLWGWCALFGTLLLLGYATKTSATYSRRLLLSWGMVTPVLILIVQMGLCSVIAKLRQNGAKKRRVVIAGVNEHAKLLADKIRENPQLGLQLDGHFDDRGIERLGEIGPEQLLGKLADLPEYVRSRHADLIYIALPMRNIQRVTELLDELHDTTVSIYFVPDVFVFDLIQCRTDDIAGLPVVALCETPFYGSRGMIKRASDIVIALGFLILSSPLLLLIAIAIKLTTPGSVIFKQRRYGLDSREIVVYKFRTMTVSEDSDAIVQASRNDTRITRVGAFLRRYSLDELPQLINVLQGRMSIVGPRPHAVAHNEEYRRLIKGYMIRHKVNPGLTGLAQVRGLRGETATVDDMRRRVDADLEYLRTWSLDLDLKIIFRTAAMVLFDKKAY